MSEMWNALGFGLGAVQSVVNTAQSAHINQQNIQFQKEENAKNRAMVRQQNALNIAQAERAYRRSTAGHQVGLMMQAGMSRAGAINAINGGGHYTPAPVNAAQGEAPQAEYNPVDMSNAIQAATAISAQKSAEKMQAKQIKAQQEENAANRQNAVDVAEINAAAARYTADSTATTAGNRLAFDREQWLALDSYRKEQVRQLKISNDLQDRLADINYQQAVENVGLTRAQKFLTYTQEDKLYEELQDFLDAADARESARETQIAEDIVRQMCAATDFEYKYLTYEYITSLEGRERENAILRAESWWKLAEARFGGVAQVLGKVAMAAGLIYFGKGAGLKWMQKLGAPPVKKVGF